MYRIVAIHSCVSMNPLYILLYFSIFGKTMELSRRIIALIREVVVFNYTSV